MSSQIFWNYYPNIFTDIKIANVINECNNLWNSSRNYYGQEINVTRKSCVFTDNISVFRKNLPSYNDINCYEWKKSPITLLLKTDLESILDHKFDYVLLHCYTDGKANIAYHNDKESLDGLVASVSIGAKRKFRIRKIDETKGYLEEFELGNGDLFVMEKGMQRRYLHSIIKQLRINEPRCNWTFRNFKNKV